MTPLQNLVLNRLAELNLTYREAAQRSGGLTSHATINQIALGRWDADKISPKTVRGVALALDVSVTEVEEAIKKSGAKAPTEFRLPKKADKLSPAQRRAVVAFVDALLERG